MADELKRLPRSFVNPLQAVRESAIGRCSYEF